MWNMDYYSNATSLHFLFLEGGREGVKRERETLPDLPYALYSRLTQRHSAEAVRRGGTSYSPGRTVGEAEPPNRQGKQLARRNPLLFKEGLRNNPFRHRHAHEIHAVGEAGNVNAGR